MTHTLTTFAAHGRTLALLEDAARRRTVRDLDPASARFRMRPPRTRRQA